VIKYIQKLHLFFPVLKLIMPWSQATTSPLLVSTVERLAVCRDLQPVPLKPPVAAAAEGRRFRDSLDAAAALSAAQLATIGLFAAASALAHSQKVSI
jgi:hypothetical protein